MLNEWVMVQNRKLPKKSTLSSISHIFYAYSDFSFFQKKLYLPSEMTVHYTLLTCVGKCVNEAGLLTVCA
jgi:hypothetical protein